VASIFAPLLCPERLPDNAQVGASVRPDISDERSFDRGTLAAWRGRADAQVPPRCRFLEQWHASVASTELVQHCGRALTFGKTPVHRPDDVWTIVRRATPFLHIGETDCVAEHAVHIGLVSSLNSLLTGNLTGNSWVFFAFFAILGWNRCATSMACKRIP
jgi:hypothetical protein